MREIKFRAWNTIQRQFVKSWEVYLLEGDLNDNDADTILLQYTGLKDKNNKEIFEGDIISKAGAFVVWNNELSCWCFTFEGDEDSTPLFYDRFSKLKVIGNIHENPELKEQQ